MTSRATEIDQSSFRKKNDVVSIGEKETVDLRFNINDALGRLLKPCNVDFNVKMTDITDDGVIFHGVEVFSRDDVATSSRGDEDVSLRCSFIHGEDFVAFKTGLESIDRIDFCDEDSGAHTFEGFGTSLADVTVSCDNADFTSDHDVCGPLNSIDQGFTAAVYILTSSCGKLITEIVEL